MSLQYPEMRAEVVEALAALADPDHQRRVWLERRGSADVHDSLDANVHILFDDIDVCVDPDRWVGVVLQPGEVEPLRRLGAAFGALIDDLGDVPDEVYVGDPRWPSVVELARAAAEALRTYPG